MVKGNFTEKQKFANRNTHTHTSARQSSKVRVRIGECADSSVAHFTVTLSGCSASSLTCAVSVQEGNLVQLRNGGPFRRGRVSRGTKGLRGGEGRVLLCWRTHFRWSGSDGEKIKKKNNMKSRRAARVLK